MQPVITSSVVARSDLSPDAHGSVVTICLETSQGSLTIEVTQPNRSVELARIIGAEFLGGSVRMHFEPNTPRETQSPTASSTRPIYGQNTWGGGGNG
jgi:hypothetical protein